MHKFNVAFEKYKGGIFIVVYGLESFILLRILMIFRLFLQFMCEDFPWRTFETVLALLVVGCGP